MSIRKINGNYNFIGENLRKIRLEKHLSQANLIKDLNLMGISMYKNDIWRIETNQRIVKDYELWGFVEVLHIKFEDLFENAQNKLEQ